MTTTAYSSHHALGLKFKIAVAMLGLILIPMAPSKEILAGGQESAVAEPESPKPNFPQIVKTIPKSGATDVKTSLQEITVFFDRDMATGMSWTGGPPLMPTADPSRQAKWIDKRTCVFPVKLQRAKFYRVGINAASYQNFKSVDGVAIPPTAIYFVTEGANAKTKAMATTPKVVKAEPANGATNVDPAITQISVTFNVPMSRGMSWIGGGKDFPELPADKQAVWSVDKKTCTLPVALRPNQQYRIGLNSTSHRNFQSESGILLEPVLYEIKTN